MENKNHVIEIDEVDGMETSMIKNMESSLRSLNYNCSIYKIPEFIRRDSEESYRPKAISIGPIYYQDPQLQTMQQVKWIYLESFLKHPKNACRSLEPYIKMVRDSQEEIRAHYQQQQQVVVRRVLSPSRTHEFIQMIVLDAVFLLSCILRLCSKNSDLLLPVERYIPREVLKQWPELGSDLILGENQVPFLVLKRIFSISFPTEPAFLLIDLTRTFISEFTLLGSKYVAIVDDNIDAYAALNDAAHILDFYWRCCCLPYQTTRLLIREKEKEKEKEKDHHYHYLPRTAKQLSDAGVQFKTSDDSSLNPLNVTFNNRTGELHLPKLIILDDTEAIMRSILFFEQCNYFEEMLSFVDLVVFLDKLITDIDDVQVLLKTGIIENHIGSTDTLLNFFKKINKNINYFMLDFNYSSVSEQVNIYANKRRNRWRAILLRDYFNHPWAILSFIFAVILFILTLLQTITAFTNN